MTPKNFLARGLARSAGLLPNHWTTARRGCAGGLTCLLGLICLAVIESPRPALKQPPLHQPPFAQIRSGSRILGVNLYRSEPLSFEANRGQAPDRAQFVARTRRSSFLLVRDGLIATVNKDLPAGIKQKCRRGSSYTCAHQTETIRLSFSGADPESILAGSGELETKTNYYPGPSQEIRLQGPPQSGAQVTRRRKNQLSRDSPIEKVPNFERVVEKNLYPGVDLVYHGNGGELEYDFIVAPDAKTEQIHLKFSGVERIKINRAGDLVLHTKAGDLKQLRPRVYESTAAGNREINGGYFLLARDEVGFRLERQNPRSAVVIDPVLNYATYFGNTADEAAKGVGVDAAGNAYIAGTSTVTAGSTSADTGFVSKYSPTGTRLFTTYIGNGTCNTDILAIAVDGFGNSYVTGETLQVDSTGNCASYYHVLAAKLSPGGSVLYSSTFGGASGSDQGKGIAVDSSGNAYIAGDETSTMQFPVTPGAFMTTTFAWIGFVSKIDPTGTAFVYSTFLGGTSTGDSPYGIAVDAFGDAYITGYAASVDFPLNNAYQSVPNANGLGGAFFTVLDALGSGLIYSTYLSGKNGAGGGDSGFAVAIDPAGNAYITGETKSPDFPATAGAYDTQCGTDGLCNPTQYCDINGCRLISLPDVFVAKINPGLSGAASLIYSTYLGGESYDEGHGIAVDRFGNAYVTGYTISTAFPQVNALQSIMGSNAFVTELNPSGSGLLFSTYFGGSGTDYGNGITLDSVGNILVAGSTTSANFPIKNASQSSFGGGADDAFVARFGLATQVPHVRGDFDGDGKADVAVFRPSIGTWFIIPSSNPTSAAVRQWGTAGDIPVPGDYDGDGKTDVAVYRPSSGTWFVVPSGSPLNFIVGQWGTSGDIPVQGDYDGDGKTDLAVFRPSSGTWYIIPSSNPSAPIVRQWGTTGDIPVPGDYDGDGKTDIAVFRPSSGTWYIIPSSNPSAPIVRQWGTTGDMPVPGDYDGDGKTDVAVFRPSLGMWFIVPTSNPSVPILQQWGTTGDIPVPVDYDRDAKTDIAVWRPSNGTWYIIPSATPPNFTVTQWGANGDVPVQKPIGQ